MKYICKYCGYPCDEEKGDFDKKIAPGTLWKDVPSDFCCPSCGAAKDTFLPVASSRECLPLPDDYKDRLNQRFADRIEEIKHSASRFVPKSEVGCFYLSGSGSDDNDGRTPATAWRTLDKLMEYKVPKGSTVLFERGSLFRGWVDCQPDCTYTAYGEGPKPILTSSPEDAAVPEKWIPTDVPNIWRFADTFKEKDVGVIFFNGKEAYGIKAVFDQKKNINLTTEEPFTSWHDLNHDLHFYFELSEHTLYLRSDKGNPGERFHSIIFNVQQHIMALAGDNIRIDNLCLMYGGAHGIASGTRENFFVTDCEIAFIGGTLLGDYNPDGTLYTGRYGNGIEIYGGCNNYTVSHCYFHDIYDAACTVQINLSPRESLKMLNVLFSDNIMEDCYYSTEYFMYDVTPGIDSHLENWLFINNLMRRAGGGFTMQRRDRTGAAHVKSGRGMNPAKNFVIRNNVMWGSNSMLTEIRARTTDPEFFGCIPVMKDNIYIQNEGGRIGFYAMGKGYYESMFTKEGIDEFALRVDGGEFYYDN